MIPSPNFKFYLKLRANSELELQVETNSKLEPLPGVDFCQTQTLVKNQLVTLQIMFQVS